MGKYTRRRRKSNPKVSPLVDVNSVSSCAGVLTRSRARALRNSAVGAACVRKPKRGKQQPHKAGSRVRSAWRFRVGSGPDPKPGDVQRSVAENLVLDFQTTDRSTRETTPCSLIKDAVMVTTPGSLTKPVASAEGDLGSSGREYVPAANEMDKFFTGAEEEQRTQFIEKYNFDPANEQPLPGRYEWVKVNP